MQLNLYSPEYLGLHKDIYPRSAHWDTPLDSGPPSLRLLPLHPLVSDDQEIGESSGFQEQNAPYIFTRTHTGDWPL